jgi:hypothetical protein
MPVTNWMRFIAPSLGHAVGRTLLTLAAAVVILAGTVALRGLPTQKLDLHRNEKLIFATNFRVGMYVLLIEVDYMAVVVYIGLRVFQIRL